MTVLNALTTLQRLSLLALAFALISCGKPPETSSAKPAQTESAKPAQLDNAKPAEIDYAKLKYSDDGIFLDPATQKPFTGIAREKYPNGQPAKEYPMKDGKLHGLVREWYKNGQPSASTEFQNGERTGKNTEWKESGALYMERVYDHDHIVSEKKY